MGKEKSKMKDIKINGHVLGGALLVDDPDIRRTFTDAAGNARHVRSFRDPARLKAYMRKHPEGIILAGVGTFFFIEPVPLSFAMVGFDDRGNADITVREGAEAIEKQLRAMDEIREAAAEELWRFSGAKSN